MPRPMPARKDPSHDLVNAVREACEASGRPTSQGEAHRAVEPLAPEEREEVRRVISKRLPHRALSPDAVVDLARGTPADVVGARQLVGYYSLIAERDALAALAQGRGEGTPAPAASVASEAPPAEEGAERAEKPATEKKARSAPAVKAKRSAPPAGESEAEQLMTLFAYHRDPVRVAQELRLGMGELHERIESLGLRRRIHRLLERTTDIEVFSPRQVKAPRAAAGEPRVRKRGGKGEPSAGEEPVPEPPPPGEIEAGAAARARGADEPSTESGEGRGAQERTPPSRQPPRPDLVSRAANRLQPRREYVRAQPSGKAAVKGAAGKKAEPAPPAKARLPFESLLNPAGRGELERLFEEKANPRVLAAKIAETYEGRDGRAFEEDALRFLLEHHGLTATFRDREIANVRFLIGFHQGARGKLANALRMTPAELVEYLDRLGLTEELERTRAERARQELGRSRLRDRVAQVLTRAPYLDDLGVLPVIDREVRDHLERLISDLAPRTSGAEELAERLRGELDLEPHPLAKLLRRYDLAGHLGREPDEQRS